MTEDKGLIHDLNGMLKSTIESYKTTDQMFQHGTSRIIGPAATLNLKLIKIGVKGLGRLAWSKITGKPIYPAPSPDDLGDI